MATVTLLDSHGSDAFDATMSPWCSLIFLNSWIPRLGFSQVGSPTPSPMAARATAQAPGLRARGGVLCEPCGGAATPWAWSVAGSHLGCCCGTRGGWAALPASSPWGAWANSQQKPAMVRPSSVWVFSAIANFLHDSVLRATGGDSLLAKKARS